MINHTWLTGNPEFVWGVNGEHELAAVPPDAGHNDVWANVGRIAAPERQDEHQAVASLNWLS